MLYDEWLVKLKHYYNIHENLIYSGNSDLNFNIDLFHKLMMIFEKE